MWPLAACLGVMMVAACQEEVSLLPCAGEAVADGAVAKQKSTLHGDSPCQAVAYGDSIGTDTTTQTVLYALDSIGTDTTSSSESMGPCSGRFVADGHVVAEKSISARPCRLRAYFDSIGTDTTTMPPRTLYRFDSVVIDTSGSGS